MGAIEWGPVGWRYKGLVMCFFSLFFFFSGGGVWRLA